ncbi:hypothetical protein J5X98_04335 [Leptothermofonsia sichuanensis E412]|uniref:hypothetical protein n=1 Tax=Leptothermofonsia sichuanensis TaxID=2917832 RepID=UPI001CA77648|nr:hypothetical protein [Leptothermofonsia sichuanensis]QZZ21691.1 hypothetical protein J5X98_04335 [Leptothermofonsia sichuanensis E412]
MGTRTMNGCRRAVYKGKTAGQSIKTFEGTNTNRNLFCQTKGISTCYKISDPAVFEFRDLACDRFMTGL